MVLVTSRVSTTPQDEIPPPDCVVVRFASVIAIMIVFTSIMHIYNVIYIYIHVYIERGRERECILVIGDGQEPEQASKADADDLYLSNMTVEQPQLPSTVDGPQASTEMQHTYTQMRTNTTQTY